MGKSVEIAESVAAATNPCRRRNVFDAVDPESEMAEELLRLAWALPEEQRLTLVLTEL